MAAEVHIWGPDSGGGEVHAATPSRHVASHTGSTECALSSHALPCPSAGLSATWPAADPPVGTGSLIPLPLASAGLAGPTQGSCLSLALAGGPPSLQPAPVSGLPITACRTAGPPAETCRAGPGRVHTDFRCRSGSEELGRGFKLMPRGEDTPEGSVRLQGPRHSLLITEGCF